MIHRIATLEEFTVVGITVNEDHKAERALKTLWNTFYSENIINKIPQKLGDEIISLYTDYEKDHTRPYSVVLGHKVKSTAVIPDGMVSKTVPASKYAVFHVEGTIPQDIIKAWVWIWDSNLQRTYTGDFEIYKNPQEVDIYVAIK